MTKNSVVLILMLCGVYTIAGKARDRILLCNLTRLLCQSTSSLPTTSQEVEEFFLARSKNRPLNSREILELLVIENRLEKMIMRNATRVSERP